MKLNTITQTVNFTAGKVNLYTDFDGTFFPSRRSAIKEGKDLELMKEYSSKINEFFKTTSGDLEFHITTGRDFESYKRISEFLKEKGFELPYPKSFISSNGSCEYIKTTEENEFPFSVKTRNEAKVKGNSKLTDTFEALQKVHKENDLLVVAGNSRNDFEMLNPLEYIKKEEWELLKSKSAVKSFYEADMSKKLSDLKDVYSGKNLELGKQLEADGLLKKIDDLPLQSIVVKGETSDLAPLVEAFEKTGKVISVENGSLDSGIKKAVKTYADSVSAYKNSMSKNFKKFIYKSGSINKLERLFVPIAGIAIAGIIMAIHYSNPERSYSKKK